MKRTSLRPLIASLLLAALASACGSPPTPEPAQSRTEPVATAGPETRPQREATPDPEPTERGPDIARGTETALGPETASRPEAALEPEAMLESKPAEPKTQVPVRSPRSAMITGRVASLESGQGLRYSNMVLTGWKGTQRGAQTKAGGTFRFENLPPGEYIMKVMHLGYKPVTEQITLAAGDSAHLEFQLETTVVKQFDVFTTEGSAIMVEVKDTEFTQTIGSEDLTDYAVDKVEEAVARQAGLVARDGELHVRGGRSGENSFRVEGIAGQGNLPKGPTGQLSQPSRRARPAWSPSENQEIWVIERTSGPVRSTDDRPGCGAMLAQTSTRLEVPLPLKHTSVQAQVVGYVAAVEVTQQFHNPFEEKIEASYVFPLPEDAAVNDFVMEIGNRRIRGIIREREEAQRVYAQAKQRGHTASLLQQERPNIFTQKVANIEPGKRVDVRIHYFNTLAYVDGWYEFVFPMVVGPRFNPPHQSDGIDAVPRGESGSSVQSTAVEYLAPDERSGHDIDLTLEVEAGVVIEDWTSVNHAVEHIPVYNTASRFHLSSHDRVPNRDFVLRYKVAGKGIRQALLTQRDDRDGYFSFLLLPPESHDRIEPEPVEMVFVIDVSGSMAGWPLNKAKIAMERALKSLRPDDTFNVVCFASIARTLSEVPLGASSENVQRGLDFVSTQRGSGGTRMIEGIRAALMSPHDPQRRRIVSFMTDGNIGNEVEIFRAIHEHRNGSRLFSFGVGKAPNRYLIEGIARVGHGAAAFIGAAEHDGKAVDVFYQRLRRPALTDIDIDWGDMAVSDMHPTEISDLYVGRPVLVTGRFSGEGRTTVTMRGRMGGRLVVTPIEVDLDVSSPEYEGLASIWARQQIRGMSDVLATDGDGEMATRIQDLALDYSLVSAYTSFVAVDASRTTGDDVARLVPVAVPVPEGVRYGTTVASPRRQ